HSRLEFSQRGENERSAETKDMRSALGIRCIFDNQGPGLHGGILAQVTCPKLASGIWVYVGQIDKKWGRVSHRSGGQCRPQTGDRLFVRGEGTIDQPLAVITRNYRTACPVIGAEGIPILPEACRRPLRPSRSRLWEIPAS